MPALVRLREVPEVLGVSLRSGSLRLYAADPEKLLADGRSNGPFRNFAGWANAGWNRIWKMSSPLTRRDMTAFLKPAQS